MSDPAAEIVRRPAAAAGRVYDLIVVGGGIYGAFVALEGSRAGLRTLLLERGDFGGGASGNSLRIAHGGLRYLQTFDLRRFRRSVEEREWLRAQFPHLVQEMGCLMPLHGRGMKRPWILRAALGANDLGVRIATRGLSGEPWPQSLVLDPRMTREVYPDVPESDLRGSAFWHDGLIRSTPRLLIEVIRWSCALGGTALNYVEALEVQVRGGRVKGVRALDRATGREFVFRGSAVVNAAGESVARFAATAGARVPDLFHPTLAFNLLLRKAPLSDQALAVTPPGGAERTCFLVPWNGKILAGTWHGPAGPAAEPPVGIPMPDDDAVQDFLDTLNRAAPGLDATRSDVARVYAGLLPGTSENAAEPRRRPMIIQHSDRGEAEGLYSVSGVKYTTARHVAARTVAHFLAHRSGGRRFPQSVRRAGFRRPRLEPSTQNLLLASPGEIVRRDPRDIVPLLSQVVRTEAVLHMEDLLLRRTDWGADPDEGEEVADFLGPLLEQLPGWGHGHGRMGGRDAAERPPTGSSARTTAGSEGVGPAA